MRQQELGLQNMNQASLLHEFVKKLTHVILSLSLFSFLFLHPSWFYFLHSFMAHYNTFPSHLLSFATDKNYIFLLCNGILVFIAKYSTQKIDPQPPPLPEINPDNDLTYRGYTQMSLQPTPENLVGVEYVTIEEGSEVEKGYEPNVAISKEEPKGENNQCLIKDFRQMQEVNDGISDGDERECVKEVHESVYYAEEEEEKEEEIAMISRRMEEEDDGIFDDEKECLKEEYESGYYVEEDEEEIAMMSTEDLNRKFDDFIRKMKEELRIEAQRQLIMV